MLPDRIRRNTSATLIYQWLPINHQGLKERLGVDRRTVYEAVKLLKAHKVIHISDYKAVIGGVYPIYAKGDKPDAAKPTPAQKKAARDKRYRATNLESMQVRQSVYREVNREKLIASCKAYREANKEAISIRRKLQRAAKKLKPEIKTRWVQLGN
jgi:hypothetical protein